MNLVQRIKAAVVQRLTLRQNAGWVSPGYSSDAGETVSEEAALGNSAVWACVNLIAGTIATLPMVLYRGTRDGDRVPAYDHPLYRVLHDSPNYDQTAVDFYEFVAGSLELWGNAYAYKQKVGGRVVGLTPIPPELVAVRRRPDGVIEYRWSEDGRSHVETDVNLLHVRGFGGGPLGGMSTLKFGRQVLGTARASERAAAAMFKNGLRPSGVLTFEAWLGEEKRAVAKTHLAESFVGAMNSGRPLILEGGTKWEALTINPDDAQMLESRAFSVAEICRLFGVPPHMIGHTEKSTSWGTGLEQQTLGFQKFTLRRRLKRIEQAFAKQLLTPADRAEGLTFEFNLEGLLRGDSAARATFYKEMTGIGAMTINEVRKLENLPPVDGGDVPRMQMQNVPIDAAPELPALKPPSA